MKYNLRDIATICCGKLIGSDNTADSIIFDSRNVNHTINTIFIAITTLKRDGHSYIEQLIERGVSNFLVDRGFEERAKKATQNCSKVGFVVVESTIVALQSLAAHYRSTLSMPIVGITGSNGKTTTKEWLVQMLPTHNIFRSPKSFNSQIGVPISILMIEGSEEFAIIEAGISKPNEMEQLERIIKPDIALITNIKSAHQENFVDIEQKRSEKMILARGAKMVICGNSHPTSICGREVTIELGQRCVKFETEHFDSGSVENIANALSLVEALGYNTEEAIKEIPNLENLDMHLELVSGANNCHLINDAYSNDIHSLTIALNYMNSLAGEQPRVVILSDFGSTQKGIYSELSSMLTKYAIDRVYTVGNSLKSIELPIPKYSFDSTEELLHQINRNSFYSSTILIKGSRKFQFEKVISTLQEKMHTTVLDIDMEALIDNFRYLKSLLKPNTKTVAMAKAQSYGCGVYEVGSALCDAGVDYLAVAYIDEAIALRESGIENPIILLDNSPNDFAQIVEYHLEPEIYSQYQLNLFIEELERQNLEHYPVHLKLDTGMNRLGFKQSDLPLLYSILGKDNRIKIESIFSHLSSADMPELDCESSRQIALFEAMSQEIITKLGLDGVIRHIANSSAIERFPEAQFDMVRMGLSLYGIGLGKELKSIASLKSRILQIKEVEIGESIGYSQRAVADKRLRIAVVSIGYADGFGRAFSCGRWSMRVRGELAPTIGNISMDTCAIDITSIPNVSEGDEVTIFESADDLRKMANIANTIPYEILTSIASRIKRRSFA